MVLGLVLVDEPDPARSNEGHLAGTLRGARLRLELSYLVSV